MGTQAQSTVIDVFFENTLTYDKEFNENHRLNVLAGTSWEDHRKDYFSASGRGYPDDDYLNNLSSASIAANVKGSNPESRTSLLSFYVRANYVWKDRYLFTFTGRADASSKFAPDNQYGFFPFRGLSLGEFLKRTFLNMDEWIDEIKASSRMEKPEHKILETRCGSTLTARYPTGDRMR